MSIADSQYGLGVKGDDRISTQDRKSRTHGALIPLGLTIALGLICYGLFFNRGIWLSVIGYSVAPAERVMQGEMPYRDFIYNYTPGILWLNAALMRLFGATLLTISAGLFVIKLATLILIYLIGRSLAGNWAALIAVCLALAWIGWKYVFGVYPTQYSMLFVLLGIYSILEYERRGRWPWLLLSGISVGIVFVFKYNVGILLVATVTAGIVLRALMLRGEAEATKAILLRMVREAVVCWSGFVIVAGLMAAYLAANDSLVPMLNHFLRFAGEYTANRSVGLPSLKLISPTVAAFVAATVAGWVVVKKYPRWFVAYVVACGVLACAAILIPARAEIAKASATATVAYIPPAIFACVVLVVLWSFKQNLKDRERARLWWGRNGKLVLVTMFALGAYLEVYPRADYYHLVRVLPPVFLVLLIIGKRLFVSLDSYFNAHLPAHRLAASATVAMPLVFLILLGLHNTWRPHLDSSFGFVERVTPGVRKTEGVLVTPRQARFIEEMDGLIQAHSNTDEPIYSFSQRGTGFYFLSSRHNPTRFVWWRSVGIRSEARESLLETIAARGPKLILLQDSLKDARIRDSINANYHKVGAVADIAVYDRNQ
ncbi:MAG TPA: glycosyltransferase family 39 protein [Blastocatellia bacterium]|nr:glycosyltransferase family 39 protein [Blastocatellia bacterium]